MRNITEFEDFKSKVQKLDEEIKKHYEKYEIENENEAKIIRDGIVNIENYYNSPVKILWILKEPYDKDGEGEGGFSITEDLFNKPELIKIDAAKGTWIPIIYTSYAILKGFMKYEDMDDISDENKMANILKHIAFMNVSKFAGATTSNNNLISKAYQEHKEILLKQIEVYNPDIIIGGNTLLNFIDDLHLQNKIYKEYDYWVENEKVYIHADHPSRKKGIDWYEEYTDAIVTIAKENLKK